MPTADLSEVARKTLFSSRWQWLSSRTANSVLAGGVDKTISIIDPDTGKVMRALSRQAEIVVLLEVSADGMKAAAVYRSAERFNDIDQVRLWDLRNGTVLASFHKPGVTIIGGAPVDDHYLFTTSTANELTVWSLR
jgi:WD40 repeat protein